MIEIVNADVLAWAREYRGAKFHALLCDPPYHLTSITKRFGKPGSAEAQFGSDGAFRRASRGFMGKEWDGGDIAFNPDTWAALAEHLYPGAFIMAFSGSRGWHRQAVAMEDAGLVIHPTIFGWSFGSGFPKATRIDTQIDKANGDRREVVGKGENGIAGGTKEHAGQAGAWGFNGEYDLTAPGSDLSRAWAGHRYGLQALKPALEPIIVAQRPYEGKPLDCMVQTGAGALWIDGGRIPAEDDLAKNWDRKQSQSQPTWQGLGAADLRNYAPDGRWPANFLLLDPEAAAALDAQSGHSVSKASERGAVEIFKKPDSWIGESTRRGHEDAGGASRFFYNVQAQIDQADPVFYCAKTSNKERNAGLDNMPAAMSGMSNGAQIHGEGYNKGQDIGLNRVIERRNPHPTLKPLDLTRYLATLLLPPGEYAPRRILVPFGGVASEAIGAALAGWEEVVAVEREEEYCTIGRERVKFWTANVQLPLPGNSKQGV